MSRKEKRYHYLYKITCLNNDRYYIGIHSTDNLEDDYMGGGKRIKNSVRKHGKDAHRKEILEFFENRSSLVNREVQLVNMELLNDPLCMNIKLGGEGWCSLGIQIGGDKWKKMNEYWSTLEGKKHLSEKMKERWNDSTYRDLVTSKNKGNKSFGGKHHSEEAKKLIGSKNSIKQKGEKNSQFGTCWINKDGIDKKINQLELDYYTNNGWERGRNKK